MDLLEYGPQLKLIASGHNPTTRHSHHILFDKPLPLEWQKPTGPPQTILVWATLSTNLSVTRLSLTSEEDLFFQYEVELDEKMYAAMKTSQCLTMSFRDLPAKLTHLLQDCALNGSRYLAVLKEDGNGCPLNRGTLHFITREMDIFHSLMQFPVLRPSMRAMKDNMIYRYNAAKRRLRVMYNFFQESGAAVVLH